MISGPGRNRIEDDTLRENGGPAITVLSGEGNTIRDNAIAANASAGIDLAADGVSSNDAGDQDAGPNALQNTPRLAAVSQAFCDEPQAATADACVPGWSATIAGTLESRPTSAYRIDFFYTLDPAAPGAVGQLAARPQGEHFLGAVRATTDAAGRIDFTLAFPTARPIPSGALVTATATDADGNASEFSGAVAAPALVISWASAVSGNWNDATKWTGGVVPGAADDAVISVAGTYTVT